VTATERSAPDRLAETPDLDGAFPRLSDAQIELLAAEGTTRAVEAGEVLYRAGDVDCDFIVVLAGRVALVEDCGGDGEQIVGVHGRGRFLGGIGLLTGRPVFLTAVVKEPGEILVLPSPRLRELALKNPALGDLILRAYLCRSALLMGIGAGIRIIGSRFDPETRRLREFAARNRLPHRWLDLETDREAEELLRRLHVNPAETPLVIWRDKVLRNPDNAELARVVGLPTLHTPNSVCDLLIVGSGPAGLAAAVYGASEGLATVAIDAVATGGQAERSPRIENYLGFPTGLSGQELADRAVIQAHKFGARLGVPAEAVSLADGDGYHVVRLADGSAVSGRAVLIATGARYRKLDVPRLADFEGISIHYAATEVEVRMCGGDPVAVVGGGNSAGQAALHVAEHSPRVWLLVRGGHLGEHMSRYLVDRIERTPQIEVALHSEVCELVGDESLEAVVVQDDRTGRRRQLPARALFVFVGADPYTRWLAGSVALDDHGFVLTGDEATPVPPDGTPSTADGARSTSDGPRSVMDGVRALLESSRRGVYAVGDVRSGSVKRVTAAVGEGAMAVQLVHEFLAGRSRTDQTKASST
jgi:thioredoxin reductase (NADPH)